MLDGSNFIGYSTSSLGKEFFKAYSPVVDGDLPQEFYYATQEEMDLAITFAINSFDEYKNTSSFIKAAFLNDIADEVMNLGDLLIQRCHEETGYPKERIVSERSRTCNQLRFFAELVNAGWWRNVTIDTSDLTRTPVPKPDIRSMLFPIGPIAVFGASNFPLAFSTAGGDTASALAAGCPVIIKAHPSHPGTHALVSKAIVKAAKKNKLPEGVFSSLYLSNEKAVALVQYLAIKAVAFTGSFKAGMLLQDAVLKREEPIPIYAEMSSINPLIIMKGAILHDRVKIAKDLAASVTLGGGQFCTNPGLILLVDSKEASDFITEFKHQLLQFSSYTLLNKTICDSYNKSIQNISLIDDVEIITHSDKDSVLPHNKVKPNAFIIKAKDFLADNIYTEEIFGPSTTIVISENIIQLKNIVKSLKGQLTCSLHSTSSDDESIIKDLVNIIKEKSGRIVFNGYPTGVEVCHAMNHGGPFPSSFNRQASSVGSAAIKRFVAPVAFQDFPQQFLADELKNENPLNILRLVNGKWTKEPC
ncbi:aldehyde dehydrogenase (NADP(+)) [Pedobacter sp. Du54]|uniref:aldehyde dehydrogenase (NADP(+)) n=1 Tax=Pedobacter anseongensis TaxID=3133439 RepID=UPI00309B2AC0